MNIKRQQAMVKSVAKSMREQERKQAKYFKFLTKIGEICDKYKTDIEGLKNIKITKSEHKTIQDFYIHKAGESVARIVYKEWF